MNKKKENFLDTVTRRFYGIVGPLDEYRKQSIYKISHVSFLVLSTVLLFGNAVALLLANLYPEQVAFIYPVILEIILLSLFGYIVFQSHKNKVTEIDPQEVPEKERKEVKWIGLKSGLFWGIWMYLLMPLISTLIDGKPYLAGLTNPRLILSVLLGSTFFGVCMQVVAMSRIKKQKTDE